MNCREDDATEFAIIPDEADEAPADALTVVAVDDGDAKLATAADSHHVFVASRKGLFREENQDAFEVCRLGPDETLICVCDGVGGLPGGRKMACKVSEAIMDQTMAGLADLPESTPVAPILEAAIANVRERAERGSWNGLTTLILAHIRGHQITWANLGDGELTVLYPDGNVARLLVPHHRYGTPDNVITAYIGGGCTLPPRLGSVQLDPGTMVFAMSDGASAIIDWEQLQANRKALARALAQAEAVPNPADALLAQIEAAQDPDTGARLHHDNMTLALALIGESDHG